MLRSGASRSPTSQARSSKLTTACCAGSRRARQTSCIIWSALTGGTADTVIAAQKAYFTSRGTPVEWKYYDYDQPADLPDRLVAAGFEPDDEEVMLVAETAPIELDVGAPGRGPAGPGQ